MTRSLFCLNKLPLSPCLYGYLQSVFLSYDVLLALTVKCWEGGGGYLIALLNSRQIRNRMFCVQKSCVSLVAWNGLIGTFCEIWGLPALLGNIPGLWKWQRVCWRLDDNILEGHAVALYRVAQLLMDYLKETANCFEMFVHCTNLQNVIYYHIPTNALCRPAQ
jgi:hypothetical protein